MKWCFISAFVLSLAAGKTAIGVSPATVATVSAQAPSNATSFASARDVGTQHTASAPASIGAGRTSGPAIAPSAGNSEGLAIDLYVSPSGADSNPGTQALPFRSIERAGRAAVAGGTVHVAQGDYVGIIHTHNAGRPEARIHYVSTIKWGARLRGQGKDAVWTNHGSHVVISGFDISGTGRIGILNLGSHTLIEGNHVHHLAVTGGCTGDGGAGIDNGDYAGSDGDIVGNIVHDIGVPGACNGVHGIYTSNHGGRIANNLVYRVSAYAIHLWHAANRVTVANNTLFANGSSSMGGGIVMGNGDGPGGAILNHTKVVNNIIYDNPAASIKEFCYPNHDCTGPNNTIANNLVFNNGQPVSLRRGRAKNTITADPQFVDYRADGSGNYQLQSSSPAIAKGARLSNDLGDTATSARGLPRIGRSVDIGANITRVPTCETIGHPPKSKTGT